MIDIRWLAGTVALLLFAGCGPNSTAAPIPTPATTASSTATPTSATPTPSVTPTSTLSPDQASAADALARADAVFAKIGHDPAAFSEKEIRSQLGKVAMKPVLTNMVDSMLKLKRAGYREVGDFKILSVEEGKIEPIPGGGLRVVITRCLDQRAQIVVDQSGAKAPATWQYPEWQVQESAMRKSSDSRVWLKAGTRPASTKKCG